MPTRDLEEMLHAELLFDTDTIAPQPRRQLLPPGAHPGEVGCKHLTYCANQDQHYCGRDLRDGKSFDAAARGELTVLHTCLEGDERCDAHEGYRL